MLCPCTFSNEAEKCPLPVHGSACPERCFEPRPAPSHSPHSPGKKVSFFRFPDPVTAPSVPCIHLSVFSKWTRRSRGELETPWDPLHLPQNIPPVAFLLPWACPTQQRGHHGAGYCRSAWPCCVFRAWPYVKSTHARAGRPAYSDCAVAGGQPCGLYLGGLKGRQGRGELHSGKEKGLGELCWGLGPRGAGTLTR